MRDTLGPLEETVLLAVLHLGDHAYGVAIGDEIARRSARSVPRAAIYVALRRLEDKGLVASRLDRSVAADRRTRRLARVTPAGLQVLRASRRALNRMWAGLERIAEES